MQNVVLRRLQRSHRVIHCKSDDGEELVDRLLGPTARFWREAHEWQGTFIRRLVANGRKAALRNRKAPANDGGLVKSPGAVEPAHAAEGVQLPFKAFLKGRPAPVGQAVARSTSSAPHKEAKASSEHSAQAKKKVGVGAASWLQFRRSIESPSRSQTRRISVVLWSFLCGLCGSTPKCVGQQRSCCGPRTKPVVQRPRSFRLHGSSDKGSRERVLGLASARLVCAPCRSSSKHHKSTADLAGERERPRAREVTTQGSNSAQCGRNLTIGVTPANRAYLPTGTSPSANLDKKPSKSDTKPKRVGESRQLLRHKTETGQLHCNCTFILNSPGPDPSRLQPQVLKECSWPQP